jgi:NTP pyrophosphatase (non-canonical NTP hydrolase)
LTPDDYVRLAMRSLKPDDNFHYQLNHALHGLASEVGEIADTIKKHIIYKQRFDIENMHEELGDLLWYIALMCFNNGFSLEEVMCCNIEKLKKRYPEKFTEEAAAARADKVVGDLNEE